MFDNKPDKFEALTSFHALCAYDVVLTFSEVSQIYDKAAQIVKNIGLSKDKIPDIFQELIETPEKALTWPVSNEPVKKTGPLVEFNAKRDLDQLIYNKCVDTNGNLDMSQLDLQNQPRDRSEAPVKVSPNPIKDIIKQENSARMTSKRKIEQQRQVR
jgi:hypothetical protein